MADYDYYQGDLFTSPDTVYAHGCNSQGTMGGGIARHIRKAYPTVYNTYRDEFETNGLTLGQVVPSYMNEHAGDSRIMLNLITQVNPGPDATEDGVFSALSGAVDYCEKYGHDSITIPAIGCGIGGLDSLILDDILYNLDTPTKIKVFLL